MTDKIGNISRRKFLISGTKFIGGVYLFSGCNQLENKLHPWQWRILTDEEARLVDMICEQIIPRDEDPGAHDAFVVNYIDKQLAPGGRIEASVDNYHKGLNSLQQTSLEVYNKQFGELSWEEQTQLLKSLEKNKVNETFWAHQKASEFFSMIRQHTIEGFFGHPQYGGNHKLAGYRVIRFEYPEIIGQNRYTDPRFTKNTSK